ncbi:MAG TPA: alpha/beta family hydrolase [Acidimicrobiia bacterium]
MKLHTADGLSLEAEWAPSANARAIAVLCHPHPQYGGTMRSIVVSALFEALPTTRIACLRFNFRGVEESQGTYGEGRDEPLDVLAALDAASSAAAEARVRGPLALIGWSFGADMALGNDDPRIAGWVGIAPPLRFGTDRAYDAVAHDARPKLLVLAANDEFRPPEEIEAAASTWASTRVEVVSGASHFFVGRTEQVVTLARDFVNGL